MLMLILLLMQVLMMMVPTLMTLITMSVRLTHYATVCMWNMLSLINWFEHKRLRPCLHNRPH